jgi:hypothetical protein
LYEREVPATLASGNDTSGRMCGRVVTGGLTAIDVLASGEGEMATLGILIEPELPMTHLNVRRQQKRIGFWLAMDDRSAEVRQWEGQAGKMKGERLVSNSFEPRVIDGSGRGTHGRIGSADTKRVGGETS